MKLPSRTIRPAIKVFVVIACVATGAATGAGCGGEGEKEFATPTYPFSFTYPDGWKVTRNAAFAFGSGSGERSLSVALKEPYDQITITQYKLKKTLPPGVNGNQDEVDGVVTKLTKQAGGSAGDGRKVKYGGVPGYQYEVEFSAPEGTKLSNIMTFLFKGKDEFLINCQSSPKNRDALEKGCDEVLGSLTFK